MSLMSGTQYKDSLRSLRLHAFAFGKRIDDVVEHELTGPAAEAVALSYDLALDPEHQELMTTVSPLTGGRVNRLTHVYQEPADLIARFRLAREMARRTGMCIGARCVSGTILSSLHSMTHAIQQKTAVPYHDRLLAFLARVQREDLAVAGCITDAKGDRSKRVGEQPDPDAYLRVVDEKPDGVVVRGAKMQISGGTIAHELVCMPTTGLREDERAYALAFALPTDTRGITYVHGAPAPDFRRFVGRGSDFGNRRYGVYNLAHIFFDDVFVPQDRVFLCGEAEYTNQLLSQTSPTFRCVTTSCKCGHRDLLIGGSAVIADYNGVGKAGHIVDKLSEILYDGELAWGSVVAAATLGKKTAAGGFYADGLLANVAKRHGTLALWNAARLAVDISGGMVMCSPTEEDLSNPETGPLLEKYLKREPRGVDPRPTAEDASPDGVPERHRLHPRGGSDAGEDPPWSSSR